MALLTGYDAIQAAEAGADGLRKYADPIEDAREVNPNEARAIAQEDPSLIWIQVDA